MNTKLNSLSERYLTALRAHLEQGQTGRQAGLQLQYNRWSDGFGYMDEPVNSSFGEFVRLKETQQRWYLSDEHLSLSEGILPDEIKNKRWKPMATLQRPMARCP